MNKKISKILALIITTTLFMPMAAVAQSYSEGLLDPGVVGAGTSSQSGNFLDANPSTLTESPNTHKNTTDSASGTSNNPTQPPAAASSGSVQSSLEQVFSIQDKDFNLDTVVGDKNKNLLNNLPKAKDENTFSDLYGSVAKLMLAVATIGIFVALFVAGAIMAINQGDENATKTAKDIVKYVIIGVIIIAAAYGIVTGITRLKPF